VKADAALESLRAAAANPLGLAASWKQKQPGRKVVGTFCSYSPEELITAAGALPIRLLGAEIEISRADKHLQNYCCDLLRAILEQKLAGEYEGIIDEVLFPHTCDSVQNLTDVWGETDERTALSLYVPVRVNAPGADVLMLGELEALRGRLAERLGASIDDAAIEQAIAAHDRGRQALLALYERRRENPAALPAADLEAVLRAFVAMPREEFAELAEALMNDLPAAGPDARPRVMVVGATCGEAGLFAAVEQAGAAVVDDDVCVGSREFLGDYGTEGPPLQRIARRMLERPTCPCKHAGVHDRNERLVARARAAGVIGVVLTRWKFCEPHGFDIPDLRAALQAAGLQTVDLELSGGGTVTAPLNNRLAAFVESLPAGGRR